MLGACALGTVGAETVEELRVAGHLSKVFCHDALRPLQAVLEGLGGVADVAAVHNHLQRPLLLLLRPALQIWSQLPQICYGVLLMQITYQGADIAILTLARLVSG